GLLIIDSMAVGVPPRPDRQPMYNEPLRLGDPRLQRIPRSPVLGTGSLGRATSQRWPRIDAQGRACYTTSGRVAILQALRAIGVSGNDAVLVPTYHCPTMVEPVVRLGAEPRFYPIGVDGMPRMEVLAALPLGRVKALLAAHLFGLPQDFGALRRFCDQHGIALIEDCAHAFFGRSADGPVGSTGDLVIGSLPKFFPAVEGGCLVVRNAALVGPVLRAPGLVAEIKAAWDSLELGAAAGRLGWVNGTVSALSTLKKRLRGSPAAPIDAADGPHAPGNGLETIASHQVDRRASAVVRWLVAHTDIERSAARRRANYSTFARLLGNEESVRPLFPTLPDGAAPYVFPLLVDDPEPLYRSLRQRGVPLYRWDILWPGTPMLAGDAGASWATQVFQLCCHEDMAIEDVEMVASTIRHESRREVR
ncbi:MAG: DegT/DnrJ/EryC1/StrS family aminotransferase, partial [Rhizobacter sp.]